MIRVLDSVSVRRRENVYGPIEIGGLSSTSQCSRFCLLTSFLLLSMDVIGLTRHNMVRNSIEGMAMKRISSQFEVIDKVSYRGLSLEKRIFDLKKQIDHTTHPQDRYLGQVALGYSHGLANDTPPSFVLRLSK